ncbi:MAG TPA: SMI1/KNR4 family protein, partial [Pilimelia sp.]|nr:SMI1/KNR4 family protein [Pilimelia sp.]
MTQEVHRRIAGGRYAFQVVRPDSPMLRVRYRGGVAVGPHGFPDWVPYARAVVELPPALPELGVDEARVLDVLTANETLARSGDPLADGAATPAGWVWAHLALTRRIALVPAELRGAFRHLGGVSTAAADRTRRGLSADGPAPPIRFTERLSETAVQAIELRLGYALPPAYRDFLARTNGGRPAWPAVHPACGFVADQPFFGAARADWLQDLVYANAWVGHRLTAAWLAVGYVQGGLIAVRVRGGDEGSVWYCDDDDPRDLDGYAADDVCARLLHRCADDFTAFWRALRQPPHTLREQARAAADNARAVLVA